MPTSDVRLVIILTAEHASSRVLYMCYYGEKHLLLGVLAHQRTGVRNVPQRVRPSLWHSRNFVVRSLALPTTQNLRTLQLPWGSCWKVVLDTWLLASNERHQTSPSYWSQSHRLPWWRSEAITGRFAGESRIALAHVSQLPREAQ